MKFQTISKQFRAVLAENLKKFERFFVIFNNYLGIPNNFRLILSRFQRQFELIWGILKLLEQIRRVRDENFNKSSTTSELVTPSVAPSLRPCPSGVSRSSVSSTRDLSSSNRYRAVSWIFRGFRSISEQFQLKIWRNSRDFSEFWTVIQGFPTIFDSFSVDFRENSN